MGTDQTEFFVAAPAFDLFLAGDGSANILIALEIHQAGDVILGSEAWDEFGFVLKRAVGEIVCDAGVESSGGAGQDIYVVQVH